MEQIIAEIKRLKAEAFNNSKNSRSLVTDVANYQQIAICEQLLHFINSLPAGQPNDDVVAEINDYFEKHLEICNDNTLKCGGEEFSMYDLLNVIEYFTLWQKNQTINKACEWLLENVSAELVLPVDDKVLVKDFIKNFKKAMEGE